MTGRFTETTTPFEGRRQSTSVTIENEHGRFTVELFREGLTLDELIEHGVRQALTAAGYSDKLVDEALGT